MGLLVAGALFVAFLWAQPARAGANDASGDGAVVDSGVASWYPPTGNPTANGEFYDGTRMTAAHKTLPFNTVVDVTDVDTGASVRVRVNDRGPFVAGRVIDLSPTAASALGFKDRGVTNVVVTLAS